MLTINAKSNATIDVVEGNFPIGQRNSIKINIEDNVIKQYIKGIHTYTCIKQNNLYCYGNFDSTKDIYNIKLNLNADCSATIVPGSGNDYSNCLYCVSNNEEQGLGSCVLTADKQKLIKGKEYIFSCYVKCGNTTTDLYLGLNSLSTLKINNIDWQKIDYSFKALTEDYFNLNIIIPGKGECYIDNIQLFLKEDEIINNSFDDLYFNLNIINPMQNTKIDTIVNYSSPDDEDVFVILDFPCITNVDFQDNLLCNLNIGLLVEPKNKYLGDSVYNKTKYSIYNSDCFVLCGYIIPSDSCDCDNAIYDGGDVEGNLPSPIVENVHIIYDGGNVESDISSSQLVKDTQIVYEGGKVQ